MIDYDSDSLGDEDSIVISSKNDFKFNYKVYNCYSDYAGKLVNEKCDKHTVKYEEIDIKHKIKIIKEEFPKDEVYKCYKKKSVNSCDNEVTDFKKKNIKIDEVEIRKIAISGGIYNQVVYKGSFGKNIYSYIKDTDYYRVIFKYKDGSKTYNIDYNFFTNILQPEVL